MTNDPPDLSRPCPLCPDGVLLEGVTNCPNPACPNYITPLLIRTHPETSPVWAEDIRRAPLLGVVRYHHARFADATGRGGWAWRRE